MSGDDTQSMDHIYANIAGASNRILLKYQGAVTAEVIDSMLAITMHRLERIEPNINMQKKVYTILMECAQNLCLHVEKNMEDLHLDPSCGYLSLEGIRSGYQVISANFVSCQKINSLVNLLEHINSQKTTEDLKKLYNQVMINRTFGVKGGGGLGLIDVARRSTGKLNYSLDAVNNKYSFFTLNVTITR